MDVVLVRQWGSGTLQRIVVLQPPSSEVLKMVSAAFDWGEYKDYDTAMTLTPDQAVHVPPGRIQSCHYFLECLLVVTIYALLA
jgi:hypothetical protein